MFRIPSFHQMPNMTFAEAEGILKINGSILTGMEHINEHWDRYASGKSDDMYEDDDLPDEFGYLTNDSNESTDKDDEDVNEEKTKIESVPRTVGRGGRKPQ